MMCSYRLGRHLASILAHSAALCAAPTSISPAIISASIPSSPISPDSSRHPSISDQSSIHTDSFPILPPPDLEAVPLVSALPVEMTSVPIIFPVFSLAKRVKLIGSLQSWTFDAMSMSSDELLGCVGIMFESLRNMHGVDFDLGSF